VFCSRSEFEQKVAEKFFIETVQLFELEHLYGLPRLEEPAPGAPVPVLMLRATLLDRVARHLSNYAVYQVEAPAERVRAHLETRAERDGEQGSRFADFERELSLGRRFAQRVIDTSQGLELAVRTSLQYLEQDFGQCPRTEVVSCVE
jgi:guanylate kinase